MRRLSIILLMGLVVVLAAALSLLLAQQNPTTEILDKDLVEVRAAIADCEKDLATYEGGLIKALAELRKAALRNTEAMLLQKRTAALRMITLDYRVDGVTPPKATDADLNDILDDIQEAQKKLGASEKEADKYAGGLLAAMTQMTIEANKLSVAQLRMKFYSAKHGLPIYFPSDTKERARPPGKVTPDREVL